MSIWQFNAAVDGYIAANAAKPNALSESEKEAIFDWIEADSGPRVLTTQRWWLDGDHLVPLGVVTFRV